MARRIVTISKKKYEEMINLIKTGYDYVVIDTKKNLSGSSDASVDNINIYMRGVDFTKTDVNNMSTFITVINNEFRCFIVPTGFDSSDPKCALKHMKLNISGA